MVYPNYDYQKLNQIIEYCFEYTDILNRGSISIKQRLEDVISQKMVENSVQLFENRDDEMNFTQQSVKDMLDEICNLFIINPNVSIPEDSQFITIMKEMNLYFDSFVGKTILNWQVVIENTFKFNINQGRIINSIYNLFNYTSNSIHI